jgi:lysophospholipase L1-like esterase
MKFTGLVVVLFFLLVSQLSALELKVADNNWSVKTKNYQAVSKLGYLNSLQVNGKEFFAQKKIAAGSYLCQGKIPPLKNIKQIGNSITGSNDFGTLTYSFTEQKIVCKFNNKSKKTVAFYFIISAAVTTVLVDSDAMLEIPVTKARGNSFKWLQDNSSVEFQANKSTIWGPWQGFQVFQIKPGAGTTETITIIPGTVIGTKSFNQQQKLKSQSKRKALSVITQSAGKPVSFNYRATVASRQIPLCMIGDSITWASKGDYWRRELLKQFPSLVFIGTHSGVLGYSHAGEGGDGTTRVLRRIKALPDCPYYSLLIGTNDNGVKKAEQVSSRAKQTAKNIIKIVNRLLQEKTGVKKIFLSSILPCSTKNPLRDKCNSETNKLLRRQFNTVFPAGKVVWIEYEKPLRAISGWEKKIRLHPTIEGYGIIAKIMAKTISKALKVKLEQKTLHPKNSGVRVVNLMNASFISDQPIIAGWYTFSCKVTAVNGKKAQIIIKSAESDKRFPFKLIIPVSNGQRVMKNFFTKYERYSYSRAKLQIETKNCKISDVLLEKSRPSMQPSVYGQGSYVDSVSPIKNGELLEYIPNK